MPSTLCKSKGGVIWMKKVIFGKTKFGCVARVRSALDLEQDLDGRRSELRWCTRSWDHWWSIFEYEPLMDARYTD